VHRGRTSLEQGRPVEEGSQSEDQVLGWKSHGAELRPTPLSSTTQLPLENFRPWE
jgi:hypothetical protein